MQERQPQGDRRQGLLQQAQPDRLRRAAHRRRRQPRHPRRGHGGRRDRQDRRRPGRRRSTTCPASRPARGSATTTSSPARSWMPAARTSSTRSRSAVNDGMDVLNLSLGGGYHGNNDLLAKGLDNAVAAGVVVVTSAGNEGPGGFTIGSPGRARDIITVGASTNVHFVGQPITYDAAGPPEVRSATSIRCRPERSGSSTLRATAARIASPRRGRRQARSHRPRRLLPSARRSPTPRPPERPASSSSTTSPATRPRWPGPSASTTTSRRS